MYTVIGAFDALEQAQDAIDRLQRSGFDRADMHLEDKEAAARKSTVPPERENRFFSHFLARIFGSEEHVRGRGFDESLRRGSRLVAVDAEGEAQVRLAAKLLHEAGAIDVDDRMRQPDANAGTAAARPVLQDEPLGARHEAELGGVRVFQRGAQMPVREATRLPEQDAGAPYPPR